MQRGSLRDDISRSMVKKSKNNILKSSEILIDPVVHWFDYERADEQCPYIIEVNEDIIKKAEQFLADDRLSHDKKSFEWLLTVRSNGTRGDQISSLLVTFEDSHVHNIESLRLMVDRIASLDAKHRDIFAIMDPLCQMLAETVLPDRKLIPLNVRPIDQVFIKNCDHDKHARRTLILWYFEDRLRTLYMKLVNCFEKKMVRCSLDKLKLGILRNVHHLLCHRSENESHLLNILVDKIGDPDALISGEAIKLLKKLIDMHPPMKIIVIQSLEKLIFRKNIHSGAKHHALSALSQIELAPGDHEIAIYLITCYLSLFKMFAATNQDVPSRLMSNLLIGMRVAFEHCGDAVNIDPEELHSIFYIIHASPITTALQAMNLLLNSIQSRPEIADRFYSAIYQRMMNNDVLTTRLQEMFLKLIYNAIKMDTSTTRQKAFLKRLLQLSLNANQGFIAGALILCSEVLKINRDLNILTYGASTNECVDYRSPNNTCESHEQTYDSSKRNPLYSNANYCVCYELSQLANHYHPTVSLFASILLKGQFIQYESNPFEDLKLINFLDRFAFKKPKNRKPFKDGVSQSKMFTPNSKEFVNLKEKDVAIDEVFLHRYMRKFQFDYKKRSQQHNEENELDNMFDNYISRRFQINDIASQATSTDFSSYLNEDISKQHVAKSKPHDYDSDSFSYDDCSISNNDLGYPSGELNDINSDDDFPEYEEDNFDMTDGDAVQISNNKEFKQLQWETSNNKRKPLKFNKRPRRNTKPRMKAKRFKKRTFK
ncbi:hypothetical protein GJ496_009518 [Pomphorhynchus laevis]|nr:hypothetical protein GJ496_009518 [Pomphorhynchus laevis]